MLSTQVLDRLGALNRQPLPNVERITNAVPNRPATTSVRQASHLDCGAVIETAWGPCWRLERSLGELWPQSNERLQMLERTLHNGRSAASGDPHPELQSLQAAYPSQTLYLDLETCGLAGAMAFLVGLLHHDGQTWTLTQLLARDYGEEKAMLQALWSIAREKAVLVTFNGKSFDWPLVHDRSTRHHLGRRASAQKTKTGESPPPLTKLSTSDAFSRLDMRPELAHCDLLHHARRRWRSRLPNCRLQTLEQYLCQRRRVADIAGRDIPAAYHEFVRTKDARQMHSILHHNALDLITLLEVSIRAAL